MDDMQKNLFKGELSVIKAFVSSTASKTSSLSQTAFPIAGPVVIIPSLAMAGEAFRVQKEAMEKLVDLLEKVINAS